MHPIFLLSHLDMLVTNVRQQGFFRSVPTRLGILIDNKPPNGMYITISMHCSYCQAPCANQTTLCHPCEYLFRFPTSMTPYSFKQSMYREGNIELQYITQLNRRTQYAPYHSVAYITLLSFGFSCLPAPASFLLWNVTASSHHLRSRFRYAFANPPTLSE